MKRCSAYIETSQVQDVTAVVTKPCFAYGSFEKVRDMPSVVTKPCHTYSTIKEVQELPTVPSKKNELADYEQCEQMNGIYEEIPK